MEDAGRIAQDSRRVTEERTRLLRAAVERRLEQRRQQGDRDQPALGE